MSRSQRFTSSATSRLGMSRLRSKMLTSLRRETQKIIIDDVDMTPKRLFSKVYTFMDERQQSMFEFLTGRSPSTSSINLSRLTLRSSDASAAAVLKSTGTVTQSLSMLISWSDDTSRKSIEDQEIPSARDSAPRMFWLPIEPEPKSLPPRVTITLTETPTFFFLDLVSHLVPEDSEEIGIITHDNEYYQNINESLKKTNTTAVQTVNPVNINRETLAVTNPRKNNSTFVCNYEMFDTLTRLNQQEVKKEAEKEKTGEVKLKKTESKAESMTESMLSTESETSDKSAPESRALDKELQTIVSSDHFQNACSKMERLLASNVFMEEQKAFRGLTLPDPLRLDVEFKYHLRLLWSFSSEYVKGKNVTGMCWNKANADLLAVSYGKYYYTDETKGMVCCWSIKNPTQPERIYTFDSPVTAIDFSKVRPNLLVCGFYDGSVLVIDISSRLESILAQSDRETSPSYEPVWQVFWYYAENGCHEEQIMSSCNDGRIGRYKHGKVLTYFPLLRIDRAEGEPKGISYLRPCKSGDIPVSRFSAALVLTRHPEDPLIYYVGTDEGCIHKCSTNYLLHHLDVFLAHNGPIYAMQFSPFCSKVFLTCGADWSIRIWCEGIAEPLLTLTEGTDPVQGAVWSPINSTIIASISGSSINLWDIRRKTLVPASSTHSPTKARNVMVQFTASGLNVVAADIEGNVHVFSLEDMPFSPFFQESALVEAIKNALITRPALLKLLKKLGKPFTGKKGKL